MFKKFVFIFVCIFSIITSYSATIEINSSNACNTISSNNNYIITENLTCLTTSFFRFSATGDNVSIDCQNHTLFGNLSNRIIDWNGEHNINMFNCKFNTFLYIYLAGNNYGFNFENISIENGFNGIYMSQTKNSNFKNILSKNTTSTFYLWGATNNITVDTANIYGGTTGVYMFANDNNTYFNNIKMYNTTTGVKAPTNNAYFSNLDLRNTSIPIDMDDLPTNVQFTNSQLGNSSKFWYFGSAGSQLQFSNNYYTNFNGSIPFCFSSFCDESPNGNNQLISQTTTNLPSINSISIIISIFVILSFLIF